MAGDRIQHKPSIGCQPAVLVLVFVLVIVLAQVPTQVLVRALALARALILVLTIDMCWNIGRRSMKGKKVKKADMELKLGCSKCRHCPTGCARCRGLIAKQAEALKSTLTG